MAGAAAGESLPAAYDRVDVERIQLEPVAAPSAALGGDYRGAAPHKAVEYDVAAGGGVQDRVCHHCDRFDGRMKSEQLAFIT